MNECRIGKILLNYYNDGHTQDGKKFINPIAIVCECLNSLQYVKSIYI